MFCASSFACGSLLLEIPHLSVDCYRANAHRRACVHMQRKIRSSCSSIVWACLALQCNCPSHPGALISGYQHPWSAWSNLWPLLSHILINHYHIQWPFLMKSPPNYSNTFLYTKGIIVYAFYRERKTFPLSRCQEEDLNCVRERWSDALIKRREYLDEQIKKVSNKKGTWRGPGDGLADKGTCHQALQHRAHMIGKNRHSQAVLSCPCVLQHACPIPHTK